MQTRTIAFIGAGNMSRAIISGLVADDYPAQNIIAANPSEGKLDALQADFGIRITQDNADAVAQADVVVLAVKPQIMQQMCVDLQSHCDFSGKLFVSIAAGINSARLLEMLGGDYPLVRTMPNTPSALGKGLTGLYADASLEGVHREFATQMMSAVGETVWVDEEHQIDGVIAAAGSSPAYFFLFLEAMQEEALRMGFDKPTARLMVQQAMLGAAEMVCHNPELELNELRAQVTSKGGTTAKAIETFQHHNLATIVAKAMQAAVARAQQMSEQI